MATTELDAEVDARPDTLLIDTDVHEVLTSRDRLFPYLAPHWQHYLTEYITMVDTVAPSEMPYATPQPNARRDWKQGEKPAATDVDVLREQLLEGEGVSIAILNGFFYPSAMVAGFEFAQALASAYNDWQIEHWLDKEPRLRGSIQVIAHEPAAAAREIDRVAEHPQFVQVFLPSVADRQYGDPFYRPIFEAALRNDLTVALHHQSFTRTVVGYPRYYVEWHTLAAPQSGMSQLSSMIFNGLFDRYPELKVMFLETGVAWLPWFMARADENYREFRSEVPWLKRLPSEHVQDNVRLATQPLSDITTRQLVDMIEAAQLERVLMFSSDYPHYDADSADRVLPTSMPAELRQRIRCGNALESYPRLAGLAG